MTHSQKIFKYSLILSLLSSLGSFNTSSLYGAETEESQNTLLKKRKSLLNLKKLMSGKLRRSSEKKTPPPVPPRDSRGKPSITKPLPPIPTALVPKKPLPPIPSTSGALPPLPPRDYAIPTAPPLPREETKSVSGQAITAESLQQVKLKPTLIQEQRKSSQSGIEKILKENEKVGKMLDLNRFNHTGEEEDNGAWDDDREKDKENSKTPEKSILSPHESVHETHFEQPLLRERPAPPSQDTKPQRTLSRPLPPVPTAKTESVKLTPETQVVKKSPPPTPPRGNRPKIIAVNRGKV